MKRSRRYLRVLAFLACLVVVLWGSAHLYLNSDHAAAQVTAALEIAYGGPVQIGSMDIGLIGSSTLRNFRLYDPGDDTSATPWAVVAEVQADISAWDWLWGAARPKHLVLRGVALTLRFDRNGTLLTRFPSNDTNTGPLPAIRIERGQVSLHQAGSPAMTVQGITADIACTNGPITLTGTVADPYWENWTADAGWDSQTGNAHLRLKTDLAQVTQEKLEKLPFVPSEVWSEIQVAGATPVALTLRSEPQKKGLHYQVELAPAAAKVNIRGLDLAVEQVRGKVVIADNVIQLQDVQGQVARGEVRTTAELDFRNTPSRLGFAVKVTQVDVHLLPAIWGLPEKLAGRLSGSAKLRVLLENGVIQTSGEGQGEVTEGRIGNVPAKRILLRLLPEGDGFRFSAPEGAEGTSPGRESGGNGGVPAESPGRGDRAVAMLHGSVAPTGAPSHDRPMQPTAGAVGYSLPPLPGLWTVMPGARQLKGNHAPPISKTSLDVTVELVDTDLEQLVAGLGLDLPFPVCGRASLQIEARIPLDTPWNLRAYRVEGTARLPWVALAGWELEQVRTRVIYREGVLQLQELYGHVPMGGRGSADVPQGTLDGSARVELIPQGDLTAQVKLDSIPLAPVLRQAAGVNETGEGTFSGTLTGKVPVSRLPDVSAWQASGQVTSERLRLYGGTVENLGANVRLSDSELSVTSVQGTVEGGPLKGSARLRLAGSLAYQAHLELGPLDLDALDQLSPKLRPPILLEGRLQVAGDIHGTLRPFTLRTTGTGSVEDLQAQDLRAARLDFRWKNSSGSQPLGITLDLEAPRLHVQNIPIERVTGQLVYVPEKLDYHLQALVLGGRLRVDGHLPLNGTQGERPGLAGRVHLESVELIRAWEALRFPTERGALLGTLTVHFNFRQGNQGSPTGDGFVVLQQLRWQGSESPASIRGELRLNEQELHLRDVNGNLGEGAIRGQALWNLSEMDRSWFHLVLERVEAANLLIPWPSVAAEVQGPLDARVRGTLGREWRGEADVVFHRGKVRGVEVSDWRLPISFAYSPSGGRGVIEVRETSAQVALGRVTGRASLGLGYGSRLEGQLRFQGVDLRTVLRQAADYSQSAAAGRVTGRIDFSGEEVRSLDDLTASFEASFQQTQALELPVLRQVAPFVMPGQSSTAMFSNGELRGRLAGGIVRIQRLSLPGSLVQLLVEGTVTTQGRLNLEVTANTGGLFGIDPRPMRLLGLRIPALGPIPVLLLIEATNYFANRVLHLRVTGTVRQPTVQVEPLTLVTEEALRFFLDRVTLPIR